MFTKLNEEEFNKLPLVPAKRVSWIYVILGNLQPGEGAVIKKNEHWKHSRSPWYLVNSYEKKTGRKFDRFRLADGSGWAIKRVK